MPAPTTLAPAPAPVTAAPTPPAGYEVFLTSEECAAWLRISEETLRSWRRRKIGPPPLTLNSGGIRYLPSQVMEWIKSSQQREVA